MSWGLLAVAFGLIIIGATLAWRNDMKMRISEDKLRDSGFVPAHLSGEKLMIKEILIEGRFKRFYIFKENPDGTYSFDRIEDEE